MNYETRGQNKWRVKCFMSGGGGSAEKSIGRAKPFVRKPNAAIGSGRGLPNVADGAARVRVGEVQGEN